jgi:hypothetical protein
LAGSIQIPAGNDEGATVDDEAKKSESVEEVAVPADSVDVAPVDETPVDETPVDMVPVSEAPPRPEVIIVDAPVAPRPKGNRGLGLALALVGTAVYVAVLVALALVIPALSGGSIVDPTFYYPVLLFFIVELLVTVVLNRAGWWSHIIGSVIVGLVIWLGSASLVLVSAGMFSMNQTEANDVFFAALFSPILIVAALLGREVAIWTGAILARRGRRLKVVNAEAHAAFEREQAELIPTA